MKRSWDWPVFVKFRTQVKSCKKKMCNFKLTGFEPTAFISLDKFGLPVELFYTPQPFFYFKRDTALHVLGYLAVLTKPSALVS